MAENEQESNHDYEAIQKKIEEQLREVSEDDQSAQAIKNLASMISLLYKSLIEDGLEIEVAVAFCQTYIESVVSTMLNR